MATNSQLLTTEPKNKQIKQLEQEQNHKNRDYMEGCQQRRGWGDNEGKGTGIRSINGRYKVDRRRLRIV